MLKLYHSKILIFLFVLGLIFSCKTGDNNSQLGDVTDADIEIQEEDVAIEADRSLQTDYRVPSPVELFVFLLEEDAEFIKGVLNSNQNTSKYITTRQKAINFGIYASDLAYSTVFAKSQQAFDFFAAAKKMAEELGLDEGFDDKVMKRLEKNMYNSDSLYNITNDAYFDACAYLEEQEKTDLLAYIIIGGWVESVYIAINSVKEFSEEDEIIVRIADQQFLIENILENIRSAAIINPNLKDIENELISIKTSFDKLYDNTHDIIITETQYDEISLKVKALRNSLVNIQS